MIDKLNAYFYRLRKLSMSNPELYTRLHNLMPTSSINPMMKYFIKAYKAQFGISFEKYCKVLKASIDYAAIIRNQ